MALHQQVIGNDDARHGWLAGLAGSLVGKHRLDEYLGCGPTGYVYRAHRDRRPETETQVTIKFIADPPQGWDSELDQVFNLSLVDGVVHLLDIDEHGVEHDGRVDSVPYTVWDYVPGENLEKYLERVDRIPTSFLVAVVEEILRILHACGERGVSRHGNLRIQNVLIETKSAGKLDETLQPRAPIYLAGFGLFPPGHVLDDYHALIDILGAMFQRVDTAATAADHNQLIAVRDRVGKLLNEQNVAERRTPMEILTLVREIRTESRLPKSFQAGAARGSPRWQPAPAPEKLGVGQFQVSEMIGDRWSVWKELFVPTVPARSRILGMDIPTVVTGPRGCGKTMLFRRLSERIKIECGEVPGMPEAEQFVAFYVNANDFPDAFPQYPSEPTASEIDRLVCYANLCVLSDVLAVQSAYSARGSEPLPEQFLTEVQRWFGLEETGRLVVGEDRLDRLRTRLEQIKWRFPREAAGDAFPGYVEISQHRWLPYLMQLASGCSWAQGRQLVLFVDDFSTPRVTRSMQSVLNRLFLQRSPSFVAKVATEAPTSFVREDSSGKQLQDGDDFQFVDLGVEAMALNEDDRDAFLDEVLDRRLQTDDKVPEDARSLKDLLGNSGLSKTEFARRLRADPSDGPKTVPTQGASQRRGASRSRVHYFGRDIFLELWSGDTRTMIQLLTELVDHIGPDETSGLGGPRISSVDQDRVLRERGGEWLASHARNDSSDQRELDAAISAYREIDPEYELTGVSYGDHLKSIVEAFIQVARSLLLGPVYRINEDGRIREVPKTAFRIEIVDDFRLNPLSEVILSDLIRYGLFMRDMRGKSIRGAFVPRLYLRRLLLPYAALALSKRDHVPLKCEQFIQLLLKPDEFKATFPVRRNQSLNDPDQTSLLDLPSDPAETDEAEAEEANTVEADDHRKHPESGS